MHRIIGIVLLVLSSAALAQQNVSSVRVNDRIIAVGDSRAQVLRAAGEPDNVLTVENRFGGALGQRWEYFDIGRPQRFALVIDFRAGKVSGMQREILR